MQKYLFIFSQLNLVSGRLDMNFIYGESSEKVKAMRSLRNGFFNLSYADIMPEGPNGIVAGDGRATQSTWLAIWHSIWYLLHNYFAKGLGESNTHWNDQRRFEEARRLTIACYQRIIYNEWLPLFLGKLCHNQLACIRLVCIRFGLSGDDYCRSKRLTCERESTYCGHYNASIDVSPDSEFAHGAFRKFHTYVPTFVNFYLENGEIFESMPFSDTVDNPALIAPYYLPVLRGMLYDPIATKCIAYTEEVRSFFAKNKCGHGIDLMSLDLMRGRDVGVVPYVKSFERCVGITIRCWDDLDPFILEEYMPLLQQMYGSVQDIDLIVGVLAEKRTYGNNGVIGACILGEQFYRMKFGDRFFYTFNEGPYPFEEGNYGIQKSLPEFN